MTLRELYNLKLNEFIERPEELFAILMLSGINNCKPLEVSKEEFYKKYQEQIDNGIA